MIDRNGVLGGRAIGVAGVSVYVRGYDGGLRGKDADHPAARSAVGAGSERALESGDACRRASRISRSAPSAPATHKTDRPGRTSPPRPTRTTHHWYLPFNMLNR